MNLATLLSRRGRSKEAEEILREAAELQPTWGQVHYSLGLFWRKTVIVCLKRFVPSKGHPPTGETIHAVFNNLAIAYWQSDKIDDAISYFLQAIKLQPDNPEFTQNVVQLLVQRGRWRDALPHARKMVQLLPENFQVKAFLAQIEENIKNE